MSRRPRSRSPPTRVIGCTATPPRRPDGIFRGDRAPRCCTVAAMADTLRAALVKAIAAQDATAIAACVTDGAQIRALVPHALHERTGGTETAALIARWFGDSTELDLIDSSSGEVGGKFYLSYRFHGIEEGK